MPETARAHAEAILRAAIAAADPAPPVARALELAPELRDWRPHDVDDPSAPDLRAEPHDVDDPSAPRVLLLAIGKAAVRMADAAHALLGARIAQSLVIAPHGVHAGKLPVLHASHPVPDASSVRAGEAVETLLENADAGDLVLVLLSGGASALAVAPADGLTVEEYARITHELMRAGADIRALNTVRQHIDRLKGGRMATHAAPARVLGLVLSDVVGDPLDIIASGPLTPATTTRQAAARVLRAHRVTAPAAWADAPPSSLGNVRVEVIGSNALAVQGAAEHARALGYNVEVLEEPFTGEARDAGVWLAEQALQREQQALRQEPQAPLCLLGGGETTVTVRGSGRGGRNLELALAGALALPPSSAIVVGSIGTDGIDGPTKAAGAVADAGIDRADARAALDANDSYAFLRRAGGLIVTGPTGTNVMDVQVALIPRDQLFV